MANKNLLDIKPSLQSSGVAGWEKKFIQLINAINLEVLEISIQRHRCETLENGI